MLVFQAGANYIYPTLNEAKTLESPEYVLVLKEDLRKTQVACKLGTDLSTYPERNNKFLVTVTATPNPLLSQITLKDLHHHYFIYERADADAFDFDNINTTDLETLSGLVECGKARYNTTATEREHYADTTQSKESYGD